MRHPILLGLLAIVVLGCQPGPTPSLATPLPAANQSLPPTGDWTPIELPDAAGTWFAAGVIADADGFVVYGGINDQPAVWTSTNGIDWTSGALPRGFGFPSQAAASTEATVLLGAGSTSLCAHPFGEALWRRAMGAATWEAVPFVERLFCAGGISEIAATNDDFAVVGMGTGDQPFAWQSDDGMAWRDAAQGLPPNTPPSLVTAFNGGFLELGRGERTDVRRSTDGTRWDAVEAPPVPPAFNGDGQGMSPAALLSTKAGVLAIYASDGGRAISAWRRAADGSWTALQMVGLLPGDVISGGFGSGADAYLFLGRGDSAALITSKDLASWTEVAIPRVGAILGLASFGERTVLVAYTPDPAGGPDVTSVFVTATRSVRG